MSERPVEGLASAVADLQTVLNRADRATAAALGIGGADELQVLRLLLADGPMRVRDIAARQFTSNATASARLDRMERRGLIQRERPEGDRRAVVAALTPDGRRAAQRSRSQRLRALAPVADRFPLDAIVRLTDALADAEDSRAC